MPRAAGTILKKLGGPVAPAETERRAVKDPSQQAGATPQPATTFMKTLGPNVFHIMSSSGYVDTKGLGAKGGVLTYGDLNIQEEPAKDRKGLGSNGNPRAPNPTVPSFVRQTINVRAVDPTTESNTLSRRPISAASPVVLATAPPTGLSRRPILAASSVVFATAPPTGPSRKPINARAVDPTIASSTPSRRPRRRTETLAAAVSHSPYFAALLATANRRRTEQFPEGTDRAAWHTVVNTIKVMWSAGWYTNAEAEHHLAQVISSSQQHASPYARAWLGLDEDSRLDTVADGNPYPAELLGRLIDHFATVMRPSGEHSARARELLASLDMKGAARPPSPPLRARTEADAIQESLQTARATALVEAMMTAQGAVDPDLADAYLTTMHLCRIPVRGDGKCGMTVVAQQSMRTGGLMNTDTALRSINEKIETLSAADRTTVFRTSRLYNLGMESYGGEVEYFADLGTTTDTYLDSGQLLVLALVRGVGTWKFYHMNVPSHPTDLIMTEVTLECALRDPNVDSNSVGASILINAGRVAHWDTVTPISQKSRNLGTTPGSWFLQNGTPTHSSWPTEPAGKRQGGAQPASAQHPPTAQSATQPRGIKRLAREWRDKQSTAKVATTAAEESPLTAGTRKPAATSRKFKRHTEGEPTTTLTTAGRTPRQDTAQPTSEIANAALETPAKAQTSIGVASDRRLGHHTWSYITSSHTETVSTKLTLTTDEQTILTTTDVQTELTQLQASPTEQTLTVESNTTHNASSTVQNAQATTTTAKASQNTFAQTTTVDGTTAQGVTVTTSTHRSTSAEESTGVSPSHWNQ